MTPGLSTRARLDRWCRAHPIHIRDIRSWDRDCLHWRGRQLTGKHAHWCPDWDYLPIDETTPEWPCACARDHRDGSGLGAMLVALGVVLAVGAVLRVMGW